MRKVLLLTPMTLAACAAQQPQVHGVTPGHKCDAASTSQYVGQLGTADTGAAVIRATKAAVLRWAPPNTMLTMDYREDRVTIWVDEAKKITKIRCG